MLHREVVNATVLVKFLPELLGGFCILLLSDEEKRRKCRQMDVIWRDHFQVSPRVELIKATHGGEHDPLVKFLGKHEHALDDVHSRFNFGC